MRTLLVMAVGACLALALPAKAADAKENWAKLCVKCHGEDGKGDTKMGKKAGVKDLTEAKFQDSKKDDELCKSIKEGIKKDDKTVMKAYGEEGLSDDDIKALVAFVRTLKK
jgi:cytochrome c553